MQIHLLCVGKRMPNWVDAAYQDYSKRLSHDCKLNLIEIANVKRAHKQSKVEILSQEAKTIIKAIPKQAYVIALDERGESWSTLCLAKKLENWQQTHQQICLIVGSADGLSKEILQLSQQKWCLSPLTLPHGLVRVLVAEQLYRAWSVLQGHPYHRP